MDLSTNLKTLVIFMTNEKTLKHLQRVEMGGDWVNAVRRFCCFGYEIMVGRREMVIDNCMR